MGIPTEFGRLSNSAGGRYKANIKIRNLIKMELLRCKEKNPSYSLRALARRIKVPASALSEILTIERKITRRL